MTKADKFQKFTVKLVPESTKIAYNWGNFAKFLGACPRAPLNGYAFDTFSRTPSKNSAYAPAANPNCLCLVSCGFLIIGNKCKIFPKTTSAKFSPVSYQVCAGLEIPWLRVRISAGSALKERRCTLKGQARYVNVRGSVHWKG